MRFFFGGGWGVGGWVCDYVCCMDLVSIFVFFVFLAVHCEDRRGVLKGVLFWGEGGGEEGEAKF